MRTLILALFALCVAIAPAAAQIPTLEFDGYDLELLTQLGRLLYFDTNLSTPPGQSCASCHTPEAGFADPDQSLPVSDGAIVVRFGNRNAPTAAYAAFSPQFHFDEEEGLYVGGQFWDGRATDLIAQAKGPFLNPVEMNNPSESIVVKKVRRSDYAQLFEMVFGPNAFDDEMQAYHDIAVAIAAFESSPEVNTFSSKYDAFLAGEAELTAQEAFGLELYEGKALCNACHPNELGMGGESPLFTDFTYDNLGVPKNWDNPFLTLAPLFNPDGMDFVDPGLAGFVGDPAELGKHKVPTLRNIALTAPYMHNGFFTELRDVVDFYSSRDVDPMWPAPEVAENVNVDELGNLGLTEDEIDAVTAFLMTLTDGWQPGMEEQPIVQATTSSDVSVAPNPFNPRTKVQFSLARTSSVNLSVFDVRGRLVATLLDESAYPAGPAEIVWNADGVSSGTYFMRLTIDQRPYVQRVTLLK